MDDGVIECSSLMHNTIIAGEFFLYFILMHWHFLFERLMTDHKNEKSIRKTIARRGLADIREPASLTQQQQKILLVRVVHSKKDPDRYHRICDKTLFV